MTKNFEARLQALEGGNQNEDLPSAIAWTAIDPLMSESHGFGRKYTRNGAKTIEFNSQEDIDNFLGKTVQ
jgi:hypothetical protein